jgi:adenosine deaminase
MNANFLALVDALPLNREQAQRLARNSFTAAFLDPDTRQGYLNEVDHFFATHPTDPKPTRC